VAYANALLAARGHGAPETAEAFAKARASSSSDEEAPARLAADYGLWAGCYVRGELAAMRTHAAAFLADIEGKPDLPEASVAHRVAGTTHWVAGEYEEASNHLERALALFQPGRDDDLAFRFGQDAGVAAMADLAHVLWQLGDVDRATSLMKRLEARIAGIAHVGTIAFGRFHLAAFELRRGDRLRTAPHALELARITREHDLPLFRAFGLFFEGLVTHDSGMLGGGLEGMRRGAELLRQRNIVPFDGLLKIAQAEAELLAGDPDRALTIIDDTLATCDRTGYRAFEAELHRVRGEILLKRDGANPGAAEGEFHSAFAIAKQQGARSFGLRAALSLAKVYQSTSRPREARAVLAPALEGFFPAPEMPEIAEAEALLDQVKGG
jgi:predicted ATPase